MLFFSGYARVKFKITDSASLAGQAPLILNCIYLPFEINKQIAG